MTFYDSRYDILRVSPLKKASSEAFLFILFYLKQHYTFDANPFLAKRGMKLEALHVKGAKIPTAFLHELIEEAITHSGDAAL